MENAIKKMDLKSILKNDFVANKNKLSELQSGAFVWMKYICAIMVLYSHSLAEPVINGTVKKGIVASTMKHIMDHGSGGVLAPAVPAFFVISGFFVFCSERSYKDILKSRVRSIVIPYFLVNAFWVVFFGLFSNISFTAAYFTNYRISGVEDVLHAFFDGVPLYYPFWFMQTLFFMILFSPLYRFFMDRFPVLSAVVLCVYMNVVPVSVPYIFPKQGIFWFCMGYYICRYRLYEYVGKVSTVVCVAIWITCMVACVNGYACFKTGGVIFGLISLYGIGLLLASRYPVGRKGRIAGYILPLYACHEYWEAMIKKVLYIILPQNELVQVVELLGLPIIIVLLIQLFTDIYYKRIRGRFVRKQNNKNDS